MFKVGDWVVEKSTNEVKQIKLGNNESEEAKLALYGRLCIRWLPKVNDWCWYGFELVQVIDTQPDRIKICRQKSPAYEEVFYGDIAPFIGELPEIVRHNIKYDTED